MNRFFSQFGDDGRDNNLSAQALVTPDGPLTQWRRAHPDGDPVAWRKDHIDEQRNLLQRFRGGPFLIDQSSCPDSYELYDLFYRSEYEGFAAVVYRVVIHQPNAGGPGPVTNSSCSQSTPLASPRGPPSDQPVCWTASTEVGATRA